MKKGTIIFGLALLAVYLMYKNASKKKTPTNELLSTVTVQEPLFADDYTSNQSYYIPAGSIIKEYTDYFEVLLSGTNNEKITISKA